MQELSQLSVLGKQWRLREGAAQLGISLAQRLDVPEIVGRIMASRGIGLDEAADYLSPNLARLPDPSSFLDMDTAISRLMTAIENGEKIGIFGDYDVDGSCATALLVRYFHALNIAAELYIPDRLTEGYGPNEIAMKRLAKAGVKVLITVDCGSLAYAPMAKAAELGIDVIITDHHQTKPEKPACVALINPNRIDEDTPHTNLSGAGVAFMLLVGLNRALRHKGYFNGNEPDLKQLLDLVAVSTVCDMVPVTGVNRILVDRGLKVMAARSNAGLRALADVSGVDAMPGTYHAGFLIGPRINAGGRISACDLGARLLSTTDLTEADTLAKRLHELNKERQEIEAQVLDEALQVAEKMYHDEMGALVVAGEGWHPGVIGIVAARVKEKFHRPTFVISFDENGVGKGSGRSIDGIDLGSAVLACGDLLVGGGGHKMAAGLTVEKDKLAAFRQKLDELVLAQAARATRDVFIPHLSIDGALRPGAATLSFLGKLEKLEPFGVGNPEPRFAFTHVTVQGARIVGDGHLKLQLVDMDGGRLDGIAFRAMQGELGPFLSNLKSRNVTICGKLRRNVWNGRETVQILVDDAYDGLWQS